MPPVQPDLTNNNLSKLLRLREGISRFLITDINNPGAAATAESIVAVMFDVVAGGNPTVGPQAVLRNVMRFNHVPSGMNCLYMDGHVEFINYPGKFPATSGVSGFVLLNDGA